MPTLKTPIEHHDHQLASAIPWSAWINSPFKCVASLSELQRTQGDLAAASKPLVPGESALRELLCLLYGHHDAPSQQLLDAARAMGCSDATIFLAEASSGIPLLIDTLTQPIKPELNANLPTAWCYAVRNGHLHTLMRLEALMDGKDIAEARSLHWRWAAQNGHLEVLIYIDSQMDAQEKVAFQCARIHYLYRKVAENGHLRILQYLERNMSPHDKLQARGASLHHAYRFAAQNGHLDVLRHLENQMSDEEKRAARKVCSYDAYRFAAQNGHFEVLKHLEAQMDDKERAAAYNVFTYGAFRNAFKNGHHEIANHLLHHAETFAYASVNGYDSTLAFATKMVNQWRADRETHHLTDTLNPFVLPHPKEGRLAVEILRCRLREKTEEARQDVEFLQNIPGITAGLWDKVNDRKNTCELLIIAHTKGYELIVSELLRSAPTDIDLSGVDFSAMNINTFLTFLEALQYLPAPTTINFSNCQGLAAMFGEQVDIDITDKILETIRKTQVTKLIFDTGFIASHSSFVAGLNKVVQNNERANISLFSTLLGTVNQGGHPNAFFQEAVLSTDEVSCGPILDSGWVPGT